FLACHVQHTRRRTTRFDLTERESSLLSHLDRTRGVAASELAKHMSIGAPARSAAIRRLERVGYVTRKPRSRERRTIEIRLTDAGAAALSGSSVLDSARLRTLLERLSASERRKAVSGLALLAKAAREQPRREATR
ncbi:MAG TPA: MarR family transcriptional regulator, partial [Planctomycetota bacterium]|nr:MarR family transcriptional regulator [Planctomycetota bacterium]